MYFAPQDMPRSVLLGPAVPQELWTRLAGLDQAFQLEIFTTFDPARPRSRRWFIVARRRDSGAEQFSVSGHALPYVLALAVLQGEKRGVIVAAPNELPREAHRGQ